MMPRKAIYLENVFGLLQRESRACEDAPIKMMIKDAQESAPQYHIQVFFLDGADVEVLTRRRVYVHALHERGGGRQAHQRMCNYMQVRGELTDRVIVIL